MTRLKLAISLFLISIVHLTLTVVNDLQGVPYYLSRRVNIIIFKEYLVISIQLSMDGLCSTRSYQRAAE